LRPDDAIESPSELIARSAPSPDVSETGRGIAEEVSLLCAEVEVLMCDRIPPRVQLLEPSPPPNVPNIGSVKLRPKVQVEAPKVLTDVRRRRIASVQLAVLGHRQSERNLERKGLHLGD
jgi:hypothetical protein